MTVKVSGEFVEGGPIVTAALLRTGNGQQIQPGDVDTWSVYLYDQDTGDLVFSLVDQSTIWSFLTTVPQHTGWLPGGHTFLHTITAAQRSPADTGGHHYRLEYRFDLISLGGYEALIIDLICIPLNSA